MKKLMVDLLHFEEIPKEVESLDTECVVFGSDFKLLDENHVLLKVPRKDNMYSVDLKNIVPSGGLTCLFAKATLDESNLWHRRLGHINFKTLNKLVRGNLVMNQFYEMKGIKREFSVARNPQQNRVAKRKNRTLIEAARTMLADSKLPTTFWTEAVNTSCYVQNRVLVIKHHNKTPYELFLGRKPTLSFMRPFGCHVTILNTLDHLGKFDGKADEGFFVGYSTNSKAYRVFNSRTIIVEENLHVKFSKETPNIAGNRPNWLFDLDAITISINYKPVVAGNQTTGNASTKENIDVGQDGKKVVPDQKYILLPFVTSDPLLSKCLKDSPDAGFKPSKEEQDANVNNTNNINSVSPTVNAADIENNVVEDNIVYGCIDDPNMPNLEEIVYSNDDEEVGAEADINNFATNVPVSPIPTTRVHKDHPLEQIIGDIHSAPQTRRMTKNVTEHVEPKKVTQALTYPSWIEAMQDELLQFKLQKMDVKSAFLYGTIKEEVYVCQPPRFENPEFPNKVYKVEKALYGLHQAPKAWYETLSTYLLENRFRRGTIDKTLFIKKDKVKQKDDGIFISQDKYVADILKKFDFVIVKTTSTPIETNKALLKDKEAKDVDVHLYRRLTRQLLKDEEAEDVDVYLYRLMIGSLMFQVTPKVSHLHAMKRIFRYLKGQPKLGLWYPRDSPFDLEAFSDSDYAGASLDKKSTTGGCQFLGKRLISWQCKKQTIVANSTTEAEYVAAANCCGQVLWIQNQMLDYGFNFMNTKIHIDNESTICIMKNPVFHSKTKHIEIRHHFIRDSYEKKLVQVIKIHTDHKVADLLTKAFDVSRKAKRTTKISQSSRPIHLVADETVYKEWEDRMERAATTASSLEAEQDSGSGPRCQDTILGGVEAQIRFEAAFKQSNDPPLLRVNTLGSGKDNTKEMELMEHCTKLSELVRKRKERYSELKNKKRVV
ncbi:putative ribonuclease H-like domain-containing protein [Tanacetum coccineum]|uniref:Ribonuclease H-like domain-containing protein n=1 Tax=Tanacetum coccineum TaxID=301880 RepID=A0ABQ5E1H2_9ASTR